MRCQAPCLFLVLCWLLLPIWSVLAQETLEAQSIRFRLIPGGWYFVGSPPNETGRYADEAASHKVDLKPFYISVTEITNAQYARFLKATGRKKPLYLGGPKPQWSQPAGGGGHLERCRGPLPVVDQSYRGAP